MSDESLLDEIKRLKEENDRLKSNKNAPELKFKVSEKGAVSVYGLGRFPVTLYKEQWFKLLDAADKIREFIAGNANFLKVKDS